jgi:hypothetical protein
MAIKEGFRANSTLVGAMAMDGYSIMMYGKHIVKTEVTNSFSEYYISDVDFIVTNIKRYDAILGWP